MDETTTKQHQANQLANEIVDRHMNELKKPGKLDGEAFRQDFKRDVIQAICQVAGIPVPINKV